MNEKREKREFNYDLAIKICAILLVIVSIWGAYISYIVITDYRENREIQMRQQIEAEYFMSADDYYNYTVPQQSSYDEEALLSLYEGIRSDNYDGRYDAMREYTNGSDPGFHYVEPVTFEEKPPVLLKEKTPSDMAYKMVSDTADASEDVLDRFYSGLAEIPEPLVEYMYRGGWTIRIVDEIDCESSINGYMTAGLTDYKNKEILILDNDSCNGQMKYTLIHEFGHVFHNKSGLREILLDMGIDDFCDEELYNVFLHTGNAGSVYIYYNYDEEVAEMLNEYLLYPDELKVQSPRLYEAYKDAFENLKIINELEQ